MSIFFTVAFDISIHIICFISKQKFQLFVKVTHDFSILNDTELVIFGECLFYSLFVIHTPCIWK